MLRVIAEIPKIILLGTEKALVLRDQPSCQPPRYWGIMLRTCCQ